MLYVSSNGTLQQYIVEHLQNDFQKKYNCKLECELSKIDWLSLRLHFTNMTIKSMQVSQDNAWSIAAEKFTLTSSWWTLLTTLRFKLSGAFEHILMYERYKYAPHGLHAFLSKLFERAPGTYIIYDWLSIYDGMLLLDKEDGITIQVPYAANISCEADSARMQCYTHKGKVTYNDNLLIDYISGSFIWDLPEKDVIKTMYLQLNMGMQIVPLGNKGRAHLTGSMKHGLGMFTLKNEDMSFLIDPIQLRADSKKCLFDMSVITGSELCRQLDIHDVCKEVQGVIQLDCRGDLYDFLKTLQIDVSVDDVAYKSRKIVQDAKVFIQYCKEGTLAGQFAIGNKQWIEFLVSLEQSGVLFKLFNNKDLFLADSYWKIPAQQGVIEVKRDEEGLWLGTYDIDLQNYKLQENKKIEGTCRLFKDDIVMKGAIDDIVYDLVMTMSPNVMLEKALFVQGDKKLVEFYSDKQNTSRLLGKIDFECIKYVMSDQFKSSFTQAGCLEFEGYVKNGVYYSQLHTEQANIRIPKIYNVVQDITAACEFDFYNRCIQLKDIKAILHEGEISCSHASFFFNKTGSCYFMHVPLLLNSVLLSWDRGIFMLLSGGLLLHQSSDTDMSLGGQLIVEKSQLKENLFSAEFQEKLFGQILVYKDKETIDKRCALDIAIFTKDLLQVKTSFLSSKARLDLALKGTVRKPELTGMIQLVSGSFYFPYKSLDIVDGKLFFMQGQQFDPLIEVNAKGKLKRYSVGMRVSGSVFDPYVQFDASPYLTEEQIMSLLLLGIEDTLNVMVPALLTQKLKDLVFGSALSKSKLQSRFDQLLNSLNYFRFLPQFATQTGRGGLRGVFEIDASDHLHGRIDTNLMQLEDTKFDVDYSVTDDITFRVQKDGPSTYGGEVELRWKFG